MDDFDDLLNDLEGNIKNMEGVDETLHIDPIQIEESEVVEIDPEGIEIGTIEIQEDFGGETSVSVHEPFHAHSNKHDDHHHGHNSRQSIHLDSLGSHDHKKHGGDDHFDHYDKHDNRGHAQGHDHGLVHVPDTHDHSHRHNEHSGYHAHTPVDEESYRFVMNGEGIHGGKVGTLCQFTIDILDQHEGKPCVLRSGEVVVDISGPEKLHPIIADQSTGNVGRFVVQYQPRRPGSYYINILWDGQPVLSEPQHVSISDHASASHCSILSRPNKVPLHQKSSFQLRACDRTGNQLKWGGDSFQVRVKGPDTPKDLRLLDHNNGLYTVEFIIPSTGKYTFLIELEGHHIQGSPLEVLA
eukprot:TRINITY_DN11035_c0_g1_i1.p1 TRINITY_DN11035_c0_g1~~TRINITY_DN11035_c0_g1_i1.p1  ORF type:complete len:387 (+),score=66.60 TRINITY_DN11035_c0_g1_i1:102-1163(+)